MPFSKSISDIKSNLLNPATTSHFYVTVPAPAGLTQVNTNKKTFLQDNGINFSLNSDKLNLLCSDAILPGSSLATHDISGDYHGTTHRHVYRRLYDDRIDLSFYVDAVEYFPIRYFETWIKYISGEQIASEEGGRPGVKDRNYFYRMNYPEKYICNSGLQVTKFERSMMGGAKGKVGQPITYNFVDCFPIAIQSMPVSYDSSSLLKCTVSLSYIRYYIDPASPTSAASTNSAFAANLTPEQQAAVNAAYAGKVDFTKDLGIPSLDTTAGFSIPTSQSSGNSISVKDAYSGSFTLNR